MDRLTTVAHVSKRTFSQHFPSKTALVAVETAATLPAVQAQVARHKQDFTARLIGTARAAGARDPESLGRQLAVLLEGVTAQG
jgi:AcrR family transcriptional regulator